MKISTIVMASLLAGTAAFAQTPPAGVVPALGRVGTAGQNLLSALNTSCPSASPSSS